MGLFGWLKEWFNKDIRRADCVIFGDLAAELSYRKLALQSAISLVANTLAKCKFRTYQNFEELKGEEFYLWNYEPNKNQNAYEFIHKAITKLLTDNECLIIEDDSGNLHVADDFTIEPNSLYGNSFKGVTIEDYTFQRTFDYRDVLFLRLNFVDSKPIIDAACDTFGQMIAYAQKKYKQSRGIRSIFRTKVQAMNDERFKERVEALINGDFKKFLESDNAVLPLFDGMEWEELGQKVYSRETTRDIKAMADDIFDFTARALHIPPPLLKGDMVNTENAVDNFLTFFVQPLAVLFQEEINRKRYGKTAVQKGNFLKIDTRAIKYVDLLGSADAADKLFRIGYSLNDIRVLTGDEPINEEWANEHYVTKNYEPVKGGEGNEE